MGKGRGVDESDSSCLPFTLFHDFAMEDTLVFDLSQWDCFGMIGMSNKSALDDQRQHGGLVCYLRCY